MSSSHRCKIVVIGDGAVGKTCLLYSYAHNGTFLKDHVPTVFNNFEAEIPMKDGEAEFKLRVSLWDTAGQEQFSQLRQLCYGLQGDGDVIAPEGARGQAATEDVSVFVVCFAWDCPESFTNVEMKWSRELRQVALAAQRRAGAAAPVGILEGSHRPFSVVLVGTKADLKKEPMTRPGATANAGGRCLTTRDGEALRRKMDADYFVECSAATGRGVKEVFEAAYRAWYEREVALGHFTTSSPPSSPLAQSSKCILL